MVFRRFSGLKAMTLAQPPPPCPLYLRILSVHWTLLLLEAMSFNLVIPPLVTPGIPGRTLGSPELFWGTRQSLHRGIASPTDSKLRLSTLVRLHLLLRTMGMFLSARFLLHILFPSPSRTFLDTPKMTLEANEGRILCGDHLGCG